MADGRSRDRGWNAQRPFEQTRPATPNRRANRCTTLRRSLAADLLQIAKQLTDYTTIYCGARQRGEPRVGDWGRLRNFSFAKLSHADPYCRRHFEAKIGRACR